MTIVNTKNIFEMALDETLLKEACKGMFQIYTELVCAGFDGDTAIKIMLGMTRPNTEEKGNEWFD